MKEVACGVLAVTLIIGLLVAVAGLVPSGAGTVYTVPQVLASLPAWRGRTILVRGVLVKYLCSGLWHPVMRPPAPQRGVVNCFSAYVLTPGGRFAATLRVVPGPQAPLLATLRRAHVLAPYLEETDVPRVYRVRILVHTPSYCAGLPPSCPRAVLLDTLR
jgi:hypothetical protein